ncbi:YbhN family protein [Paraconexibacter sp.]|uniref:lysylphosphatidylglycerol synthase transmembrane domain-containing protein n=1 Tax=Paraconexibacter sp. TaxID=2949640 RepID=UPI003567D5D7
MIPSPLGQHRGRRGLLVTVGVGIVVLALLYGALPQVPELRETLERFGDGSRWWLLAALGFELASFGGYVLSFHATFAGAGSRITWRAAGELTLAGVVASRVLAAGGAGGIALTAWALRRSGLSVREVRARLAGFLVLLYAVYMVGLALAATGLRIGLFPGPAPFGVTVIPGAFAVGVILLAVVLALVPPDLDSRVGAPEQQTRRSRADRARRGLATVPATVSAGVREAFGLLRARHPAILGGVVLWWAADIAVLWACFHAFDVAPPATAVLVVAYFTGMLGNLIPLPGGVGGVEGGMVGVLLAFGVATGPAVLAVLAYRLYAFWLPIIPGSVAYFQLVRRVRIWGDGEAGSAAAGGSATGS